MKNLIFITALFLLISCASVPKQIINSDPNAIQKTADALQSAKDWVTDQTVTDWLTTILGFWAGTQ